MKLKYLILLLFTQIIIESSAQEKKLLNGNLVEIIDPLTYKLEEESNQEFILKLKDLSLTDNDSINYILNRFLTKNILNKNIFFSVDSISSNKNIFFGTLLLTSSH